MKPAIQVENLSKQYRIGTTTREGTRNLTESIVDTASAVWRGLTGRGRGSNGTETFSALKDVSFEVQPGEVVGIIGRNGAGKSTLLKILSRIAEPTSGRAVVRGRVGSLLEIGTGFHPELTGRENIYLNGSILGMARQEINRKFDEIVAFSEVERFLDTPVKRYSSGMYVRLAFAVAAHFDPEIMIIDEVLAVGDPQFQKKCLGKMRDVGRSGRTIFFVSHNLMAVKSLCTRCICLSHGKVVKDQEPGEAINSYTAEMVNMAAAYQDLRRHPRRTQSSRSIMTEVYLTNGEGKAGSAISMCGRLSIHVGFSSPMEAIGPVLGVVVKDRYGTALFSINNRIILGFQFEKQRSGEISCHYDNLPLMPGLYSIDLFLGNDVADLDVVYDAISFDVIPDDVFQSGKLPPSSAGPIVLPATWTLESKNHSFVLQSEIPTEKANRANLDICNYDPL